MCGIRPIINNGSEVQTIERTDGFAMQLAKPCVKSSDHFGNDTKKAKATHIFLTLQQVQFLYCVLYVFVPYITAYTIVMCKFYKHCFKDSEDLLAIFTIKVPPIYIYYAFQGP